MKRTNISILRTVSILLLLFLSIGIADARIIGGEKFTERTGNPVTDTISYMRANLLGLDVTGGSFNEPGHFLRDVTQNNTEIKFSVIPLGNDYGSWKVGLAGPNCVMDTYDKCEGDELDSITGTGGYSLYYRGQLKFDLTPYPDGIYHLNFYCYWAQCGGRVDFTIEGKTAATPTPNIPQPMIIPPVLSQLWEQIWSGILNIFGLSISGGQTVNAQINQSYTIQISIPFQPVDSDYSDGSYQAAFGEWFVTDSNQNIKYDSGFKQVTTSPYTATATYTPTASGTGYLIAVVVKQQYTYVGTTWTKTSETIETKEVQQIVVGAPPVTVQQPTTTASSILSSIWSWLLGVFGL